MPDVVPPGNLCLVRQSIEALNAEFAWRIDHGDGVGVAELFMPEGIYDISNRVFRGRVEIDGFYTSRKARGRRAARHIFTNLRLVPVNADRVTGSVILTLYAYDGEPPYPAAPILIADYDDVYVRDSKGNWCYEHRKIVPIFGDVPVLAAPGNEPAPSS
jgi:hypothetical protein